MKTFEQYLEEIHAKEYTGVDDDMPEAFNDWLGDQEQFTLIKLADDFALERVNDYIKSKNKEIVGYHRKGQECYDKSCKSDHFPF